MAAKAAREHSRVTRVQLQAHSHAQSVGQQDSSELGVPSAVTNDTLLTGAFPVVNPPSVLGRSTARSNSSRRARMKTILYGNIGWQQTPAGELKICGN